MFEDFDTLYTVTSREDDQSPVRDTRLTSLDEFFVPSPVVASTGVCTEHSIGTRPRSTSPGSTSRSRRTDPK